MADGISEVQFAVKLRLRLKEELLEAFQLQHTLAYITEKFENLKTAQSGDNNDSQIEVDECRERLAELQEILDEEKTENDKMYEGILKLRAAKESLAAEQQMAELDYQVAEKQRQEGARQYSRQIHEQSLEFVQCKRDQNESIKNLEQSLKKAKEENERWRAYNAEIQQEIDTLEADISTHLKTKDKVLQEKENANEDHSLAVQKLKLQIARQQRQFDLTKAEDERRQADLDAQQEKINKTKEEDATMTTELEEFNRESKKKERANVRQKEQIKTLETDKEEARRKLREAERKLRMKKY